MKQARKKGPDMYGKNALQVVGSKPDSIMQQAAHTAQHSTAQRCGVLNRLLYGTVCQRDVPSYALQTNVSCQQLDYTAFV
mmetsp:Transcript_35013/g.69117  ORF Transcript_35013/g.69117 Transcript_35013/m.69117 type:complete len:80 (+) Transcript_35013:211-450(+)